MSVYFPVAESTRVSTNVSKVEKSVLLKSGGPFGFVIDTHAIDMLDGPTLRLMRCPAVPSNVYFAFWPGVAMLGDTEGPPGAIVPAMSGGTSYKVIVAEPVVAYGGSM